MRVTLLSWCVWMPPMTAHAIEACITVCMPSGIRERALRRLQDKKTHLHKELERVHQAGQELRAQSKDIQAKITHNWVRICQPQGALTILCRA